MPVSAGIYNALMQPVKSVADYAADYDRQDLQKQNMQRNALMLQQSQAELADRERARKEGETLRNALSTLGAGATPEQRIGAMEGTGLPQGFTQADALRKTLLEQQKAAAQAAKDQAEAKAKEYDLTRKKLEHGVQWLQVAQNPQQAAQMFADGVQKGYWGMQEAQQQAQGIPQDPAQFQMWKRTQLAQILDAAKLLPTVQTRNTGATTDTLAVDPLTGVPQVTGSVRNTQSPESVASERIAAAGRAQSAAQFNERLAYDKVKDAAKDANGANITEGERNAGGYAARMVEASKLLDQFEGKGRATYKTDTLGGVPLVGRALQTSAMTAEQQQYRQAQEDWVRAKLRKESGASISPDEMAKEIAAYFPEPGEKPETTAQKKQSREVANRAMLQSAGRGAPKAEAQQAPAPGTVLKFDAQGNPVK